MNIHFKLIATLGATLLLASCGGNDNESRENQIEAQAKEYGIDADVTVGDDGEVTNAVIKQPGGAQVGNNLQLPEGFPEDVPIPSDWTVMATSPAPGGFMVNAMTDATADEAVAGIREQLTAQGWTESGFSQPNAMMTQVGFSKDDRMTNLNLMDTGDARNVSLVTMTKPN
jgi:hypothetical protein